MLDSALNPRRRPTAPQTLQSLAAAVDRLGGLGSAQRALQGVTGGTFQRIAALSTELARLTSGEAPPAPETAARSCHRPVATNHAPRPRADEGSGGQFLPGATLLMSDYPHLAEYARRITAPDGATGGSIAAGEFYSRHRAEIQREEREMQRAQQAKIKQERGY